jgi:hypothetical protein
MRRSIIARVLEENGISTVCLNMRREVAENVKPPRTLFLKVPFGAPLGPAGDAETQCGVIREALQFLLSAKDPGAIVDSPRAWKR